MQMERQNQLQVTRYRTKKDARLVFLILLVLVLPIILGLVLIFIHPQNVNNSFEGGVFLLITGIFCWILFFTFMYPSYYEITSSALIVRSGLYRKEIPLAAIQKVYPPRVVPHATWSFDQLRVDYRKEKQSFLSALFIAPKDKMAFLQDLAKYDHGFEIMDNTLVRRH